jgi:hypothetical protein
MFEQISYFMYKLSVINGCDPFFLLMRLCCKCMLCLFIGLFLRLWIICDGNPLLLAIVSMVLHSCCLACSVVGNIIILFI